MFNATPFNTDAGPLTPPDDPVCPSCGEDDRDCPECESCVAPSCECDCCDHCENERVVYADCLCHGNSPQFQCKKCGNSGEVETPCPECRNEGNDG